MSVNYLQSPQAYTPSDNPVTWVFSSDETAQENFSYYIEVYINGVLDSTHQTFPERGIYSHFDAQQITSNRTSVLAIDESAFSNDSGSTSEIYIKVFERYGTTPTLQASATSSTVVVFKAALSDEDFIAFDYLDYSLANGSKWLTSFPRTKKMYCGYSEELRLCYLNAGEASPTLVVKTYDSSGALLLSDTAALTGGSEINVVSVDITSLVAATTLTLADFEACSFYSVSVTNFTVTSEELKIYPSSNCSAYTARRVHFMNSLGGLDAFTFSLASRRTRSIESGKYQKPFGDWDGNNNFVYSNQQGREVDFVKTSYGEMEISSDWLEEEVQNWIVREFYESPFCFLESSGTLYRVRVLASAYEFKTTETESLFQEIVKLGLSDNRRSAII